MIMTKNYHFHIYFNQESLSIARDIYVKAQVLSNVTLGSFNERNVGPHPTWSFMIAFSEDKLDEITAWINTNRSNLSVLLHLDGVDDYKDHTENAKWFGKKLELNLETFS